jgi:hydrogenase expression/formation protein HypC
MCLAIPGKVVEIKDDKFIIDYSGQKREALMSVIDIKIGDYVVVFNKIITDIIPEKQAIEYLKLIESKC